MSIRFRTIRAFRSAVAKADLLFEGDYPTLLYRNQHGLYLQHDFVGGCVTIAIGEGGTDLHSTLSRQNLRADLASAGVEEYFEFQSPIYPTPRRPVKINYNKVVLRPFNATNFRSILFYGVDDVHLSKQTLTYHTVLSRPDIEAVTAPIFKAKPGEVTKPILTREFVYTLLRMITEQAYCGFVDSKFIVRCNNVEVIGDGKFHYRKTYIPPIGIHRSFSSDAFLSVARKLWPTDNIRKKGVASLNFTEDRLHITNERGVQDSITAFHEIYSPLEFSVSSDAIVSACRAFIGQVHCAGGDLIHLHSLTDTGIEYVKIERVVR